MLGGMTGLEIGVRALVAAPFVVSCVAKLTDFRGAIAEVRELTGFAPAGLVAAAVIVTQLGGSVLLFCPGLWAVFGAVWLAAFTAVATLAAHAFWTMRDAARVANTNAFFEHVAIVGGLLLCALVSLRGVRL